MFKCGKRDFHMISVTAKAGAIGSHRKSFRFAKQENVLRYHLGRTRQRLRVLRLGERKIWTLGEVATAKQRCLNAYRIKATH